MEYKEVVDAPKKDSDAASSPHHQNSNCHGNSGATTKEVMEAVAVKSAEHGHHTHAESNEFTSTQNQENCPEVKVTSQGEEPSMKDCPEYPGNILNALPPVLFNDDNMKPATLVEELVVYTEEMALFHRHEITSPRYSFNVPTQDQPVKDDGIHDDDVFISEDRLTGHNSVNVQGSDNMKLHVESCVVHSSQGLLASCDINSVPVAPWGCTNEPVVSGKDMLAIPRLSDLYDTEGEGILGVVMKEDRGHEVAVDTYPWGYSHQGYDPGYGTPLRMIDYYDAVDSASSQDGGGADEEKKEGDKPLGTGAIVKADDNGDDINCGITGDAIVHHSNGGDDGDHIVYHETTDGDGSFPLKYHVSDGDQSPKHIDSVFVNSDTVKYIDNQAACRQRRLSSYDNTFTPDDRMPIEVENLHLLENITLKDILEKPEETNPEEGCKDPSNEPPPLSNKLLTDGNGSNYVLTPDNLMTTTSSGDTSPALRDCTVGVRVTSKDSLAGLAPDWEESRSISDDAGDQLEKLALSNISSACAQAPVIMENEVTVKTNVSFVSKLKKELSKGLILPSLPPALLRGSEKYDKGEERSKDEQQVVAQPEMVNESEPDLAEQQQQQNKEQQYEGKKTIDQGSVKELRETSVDGFEDDDQIQERPYDVEHQDNVQQERQEIGRQGTDEPEMKAVWKSGVKQQENETASKEVESKQQHKSEDITTSEIEKEVVNVEMESRKDIGVLVNTDITQHEVTDGELELQSEQEKYMIHETILKEGCCKGTGDQPADNRQLFLLEHNNGQDVGDKASLEHSQNRIMNDSFDEGESEHVYELHSSIENLQGKKDGKSKLLCEPVDNLGLGIHISNDIHEGTRDVLEETLDTPDFVVTQEKENSFEKNKGSLVNQVQDTKGIAKVEQTNLKELAGNGDKLDVQSKDKSSNSSDTTKSFLENSLNEEVGLIAEQPREDDVENTDKLDKDILSNEILSLKRQSSFSENDLRESEDDRRGEEVIGRNNWSEMNQPKPPPEGSSRRCVNAR